MVLVIAGLTMGALAAVGYPLLVRRPGTATDAEEETGREELEARKASIYGDIRDLELDRRTGKVDAADYQVLRAGYEIEAARVLERLEGGAGDGGHGQPRCSHCGVEAPTGARFCPGCGHPLQAKGASPARGRKPAPRATGAGRVRPSGRPGSRKGLVAVVSVAGAVLLYLALRPDAPGNGGPSAAGVVPAFTASVQEVAAKFQCACGTCQVPELADCTCPTAVKEKRFIETELGRGGTPAEVVRAVYRRYGSLKPQYASLIRLTGPAARTAPAADREAAAPVRGASQAVPAVEGSTATTTGGGPLAAAPSIPLPALGTSAGTRLATLADTTAVAARFSCACDTCGGMPLAECGCQRRRGAAEMKAFIVYKIQQHLGLDDVVQAVAYEYGHLMPETEQGTL